MSQAQHHLTAYLQSELYHALGAYRLVVQDYSARLAETDSSATVPSEQILTAMRDYNQRLHDCRHRADAHSRHPPPTWSPLTGAPQIASGSIDQPVKPSFIEDRLFYTYDTMIDALSFRARTDSEREDPRQCLRKCIIERRDPLLPTEGDDDERADTLCERFESRRAYAREAYGYDAGGSPTLSSSEADRREAPNRLLCDNLAADVEWSLHSLLVEAFVDAHLSLHAIQSRQSLCLSDHVRRGDAYAKGEPLETASHVQRCIALYTFVFAIARAAPWIFAEDANEAARVVDAYSDSFNYMVPTYCMWAATQIGLLALHRRGYVYMLARQQRRAYNDFHKVQRLARDAARRLTKSPVRVADSSSFLQGIEALADYYMGELYRADHAHTGAISHFDRATNRLEELKSSPTMGPVLTESRWYVELQLSMAKAEYEMGRIKSSLTWCLRSWRSFLELLAAEAESEVNADDVDEALRCLAAVRLDPELRKADVTEWLTPVIEQLRGIAVPTHLSALAGEILLRLGHLLFIVRLGDPSAGAGNGARGASDDRDELAVRCLQRAAVCDPHSTLIASDLLKARHRRGEVGLDSTLAQFASIEHQWPLGGDDFDRFSRINEQLLLRNLAEEPVARRTANADEVAVARKLLAGFFFHTDSISVRKSQVHQYLQQDRAPSGRPHGAGPYIEFVCMRRYGSIFPFLPRPSAFRVLGGGYFVRLHHVSRSYGVAVDPGPDFVENLYRAGYALADVDMVIVTHDHVDHMASLDPLLSLLHHRHDAARDQPEHPLPVIGNTSVAARYGTLARPGVNLGWEVVEPDAVAQRRRRKRRRLGIPEWLRFTAISSLIPRSDTGHFDLGGSPAFGFVLGIETGPTIAFTSDVPAPLGPMLEPWTRHWDAALRADALVAHVSSVPLAELRRAAQFRAVPLPEGQPPSDGDRTLSAEMRRFLDLWGRLATVNERLLKRLEFASWLGFAKREEQTATSAGGPLSEDSAAAPVGPVTPEWAPYPGHLYLRGTLAVARAFRRARRRAGSPRVFIIGELSEELGTFRKSIAEEFNATVFKRGGVRALTADIGLTVHLYDDNRTRVRCSTCDADNDRTPGERFHSPEVIREVCVKGENEGIFYNCEDHSPDKGVEAMFLERVDRYDVFGR